MSDLAAVVGVLLAAQVLTAQINNPPPLPQSFFRMKLAKIVDQHSFERPMTAITLLIPTDWQYQGEILLASTGCDTDLVRGTFRGGTSDGRLAMEAFPGFSWQWADDPMMQRAMVSSNQQMMAFGRKSCEVAPPISAADLLRQRILPRYRPGKQIVSIESMPDMVKQLSDQSRQTEAQWARGGFPIRIQSDVARARLQYSLNGQPVEEWVMAASICTARPMPGAAMLGRPSNTYSCQALHQFTMRAPQGQLQGTERLFSLVRSSIRIDPQWQNRVTEVALKISAVEQKGAMERSAIIQRNADEISRITNQGYQQRQKAQDQSFEQFDQVIRGVQSYRNPSTGETFELSNQYNHAWINGLNEYILSDDPNFNPSRLGGSWTRLDPVKP